MIEGLWSVEFYANTGYVGAGVIVFETQRIFGGDSTYYYLGDYLIDNKTGNVHANVTVKHYFGPKNNVFGSVDNINLVVAGPVEDPMIVVALVANDPNKNLTARLTKRAELP